MNRDDCLKLCQSIIERMSKNSFKLKNWSVTLVVGVLAINNVILSKQASVTALIPILMFWILDSYYLQIERKYKSLFRHFLSCKDDTINYIPNSHELTDDPTTSMHSHFFNFGTCFLSKTELGFYLPLFVAVTLYIFLL